ncbi:TolC family protein [Sphingomonas koreensis]|uniref:TolC family protein n=1 Tax=Sphingomonas koreensis TaxID=93064 RepID=A0A430G0F8_9SPHN|nr:TolC family protein [Sphingomonas koreensis]RSY80269.1 TolC family protein [Sphingomonas koreensis]
MRVMIAALLAAASCAGIAQAQTPSAEAGDVMTLEEAVRRAGATSPANAVAALGIETAEAERRVAALRPNPTLDAEVGNVIGTGPYRSFNEAETTIGFALPLELGGKRAARIGVADAQTARARIDQQAAIADLRLQVTQAYIEAVTAERRLAIAEDQVRVTAENLRIARDRVMAGANAPIDEQRAALLSSNATAEADRARRTVDTTRTALAQLTGARPSGLDQPWFDRVAPVQAGPQLPVPTEGTLALAAASADLRTADAGLRLARSQRVPDLTLSAGTRRLQASGDMAMVFGVSMPIPVFNNGRAAVDRAAALRNQSDAQRRLVRFETERAIAAARADRDRAAISVRGSGPALAAAQEAARIARIGYGEGKFDQLVLLEAEQALLDTRTAAIDARAQYHDAEARLARLLTPAAAPAQPGN